jgi:hypothetical protein
MPPGHKLKQLPAVSVGSWQPRSFFLSDFELFLTKWLSQNFYRIGLGGKGERMGGKLAYLFWLLIDEQKFLIFNQISPF